MFDLSPLTVFRVRASYRTAACCGKNKSLKGSFFPQYTTLLSRKATKYNICVPQILELLQYMCIHNMTSII